MKLVPSNPQSLFQWNEGSGEYEGICPRCKVELFAPTLKTIRDSYRRHYQTEPCQSKY